MTLRWRSIGSDHTPWPAWLRALQGRCGVYAIKQSGRVVYVGSSKARLYDTITRHFQAWRRQKKFWRGMRGATSHDPGMTYERGRCEIAVMTCACGDHLGLEAVWIEKWKPRDNMTEAPAGRGRDDKPIPF